MTKKHPTLFLTMCTAACVASIALFFRESGKQTPMESEPRQSNNERSGVAARSSTGHGSLDSGPALANRRAVPLHSNSQALSEPKKPNSGTADQDLEEMASRLSDRWLADIMQIQDPGKREAALAEILFALKHPGSPEGYAAILSLAQMGQIDFPRDTYHSLVPTYLKSSEACVRRAALYALLNTGGTKEDLGLVMPMVLDEDKDVRGSMADVIRRFTNSEFGIDGEQAISQLLNDNSPAVVDSNLAALSNCKLPPSILEKALALADRPEHRERVVQVLRTMPDKSIDVVDKLIDVAGDPNPSTSSEAVAALRIGVSEQVGAHVAARLVDVAKNATNAQTRVESINTISRYGGLMQLNALIEMQANPMLDMVSKRAIDLAIQSMRIRLGL